MKPFVIFDANGLITSSGMAPDLPPNALEVLQFRPDYDSTHYVANGKLRAYTAAERTAKANLPTGCVWKMPDRVVVDNRTQDERDAQAAKDIDRARARAYPPLADLADALYWQANGDNAPMTAWLAAVAAVKTRLPKPKGK